MHWREEVIVGQDTVLASSYEALLDGHQVEEEPIPDFGMYLAEDWNSVKTSYPKKVITWPDRGIIQQEELKQIVSDIVLMLADKKTVELACFAGEGRTGVVLACLVGQLEGLKAEEAIKAIRQRYCLAAVDTTKQEKMVESYLDKVIKDTDL